MNLFIISYSEMNYFSGEEKSRTKVILADTEASAKSKLVDYYSQKSLYDCHIPRVVEVLEKFGNDIYEGKLNYVTPAIIVEKQTARIW